MLGNFRPPSEMLMESFLTVEELMKSLNLPRSFVYEHTRKGAKDPIWGAFRFGKHLRFKEGEVTKWVEKHRKNDH